MSVPTVLERDAVLSADGRYRYLLTRRWARGPHRACWVMLNPSTADAAVDDPTIRRCMSFSERLGCQAMDVVNLFALRSKSPGFLVNADDPVGPENDRYLERLAHGALVIAAWGAGGTLLGRAAAVRPLLGLEVWCLGFTGGLEPRHPLYVRGNADLVRVP